MPYQVEILRLIPVASFLPWKRYVAYRGMWPYEGPELLVNKLWLFPVLENICLYTYRYFWWKVTTIKHYFFAMLALLCHTSFYQWVLLIKWDLTVFYDVCVLFYKPRRLITVCGMIFINLNKWLSPSVPPCISAVSRGWEIESVWVELTRVTAENNSEASPEL